MSARDWTLRFKKHNVTILLLVPPTQGFEEIKETLLNVLKSRNITHINDEPVPDDPAHIEFGIPLDRNNLEKGWRKLETGASASRRANGAANGNRSVSNTSPQGADLRDSQAIAFRFREPREEKLDDGEPQIDLDDPGWDVLIPTYDDEEEEAC